MRIRMGWLPEFGQNVFVTISSLIRLFFSRSVAGSDYSPFSIAAPLDPGNARPVDHDGRQQHALVKAHRGVDRAIVENIGKRNAEHHAGKAEADTDQARKGDRDLQEFTLHRPTPLIPVAGTGPRQRPVLWVARHGK